MSETLAQGKMLAANGQVRPSLHVYLELAAEGLLFEEALAGLRAAVVVEDYPDGFKGPSVLALQVDVSGRPIHVLWGIPRGRKSPAVMVIGYRPDPILWSEDFTTRTML